MALTRETARKALPDIIFERMHRAIKSGAYKPDERLPTEHELAMEFEVSRPVVREALRRLRDQGFIYSRRGSGSYVRAVGMREPLGFGQLENVADLLNCYEFRLTLEPAAAAAAALRHDGERLAAIKKRWKCFVMRRTASLTGKTPTTSSISPSRGRHATAISRRRWKR